MKMYTHIFVRTYMQRTCSVVIQNVLQNRKYHWCCEKPTFRQSIFGIIITSVKIRKTSLKNTTRAYPNFLHIAITLHTKTPKNVKQRKEITFNNNSNSNMTAWHKEKMVHRMNKNRCCFQCCWKSLFNTLFLRQEWIREDNFVFQCVIKNVQKTWNINKDTIEEICVHHVYIF